MADKKPACVITMVKDDYFFLERWVKYYGGIFGRDALYVVNHGGGDKVADIATGCSVINLPGGFQKNFDVVRWRLFNGLAQGLRGYYTFAIVTDVDEYIVVDPKTGLGLDDFLGKRRGKVTVTPIGVEVVHKKDLELDEIGAGPMLGPRRYARYASEYCKPTIFNHAVRLSRGGHYSTDPVLKVFRKLYLFHMRFADAALCEETFGRRAAQVEAAVAEGDDTIISVAWRRGGREKSPYEMVENLPIVGGFDFEAQVERMYDTWGPREKGSDFFDFERDISKILMTVPDRFFGLV